MSPSVPLIPSVTAWERPLLAHNSEAVAPIGFLLSWIAVESQGNPCAVGVPNALDADGQPHEVGIFQLDPGNRQAAGGFSAAELRPCCPNRTGTRAQIEACVRALTDDELDVQVRAGLGYVRYCRAVVDLALEHNKTPWLYPSVDYLRAVKSCHGSEWVMRFGLPVVVARLGRPPATFEELAENLLANPPPSTPHTALVSASDFLTAVLDNARKTAR
jgi:hypothetical protein